MTFINLYYLGSLIGIDSKIFLLVLYSKINSFMIFLLKITFIYFPCLHLKNSSALNK